MTIANIQKTTARASWLLDTRADGAVFNNTIADDRFIQEEFIRAAIETESEIVRALAEAYHPKRVQFLAWSSDLADGDTLPAHLGQAEAVQIAVTSSSAFKIGESTTRSNIDVWRENYNKMFDPIDHNITGTNLAGYFNITEQTIRFTGTKARAKICTFTPDYTTPAHQISDEFESLIISGMVPKLHKRGNDANIIQHYQNLYNQGLAMIRQGMTFVPDLTVAQKSE